jgi:hypothetical protein
MLVVEYSSASVGGAGGTGIGAGQAIAAGAQARTPATHAATIAERLIIGPL